MVGIVLPINSRVVYDSSQLGVIFQDEKQAEKVKGRTKGTAEIFGAEKLKGDHRPSSEFIQ